MSPPLRAAIALVQAWTRVYTRHLPPAARDARRAEIDSDLWEFQDDARRRGRTPTDVAIHIVIRLLLGVCDDLRWLSDYRAQPIDVVRPILWASAAVSVSLLWLLVSALQTVEPPPPQFTTIRLLYPVRIMPPPPPPPFAPDNLQLMRPPPPPPPPRRVPAWKN